MAELPTHFYLASASPRRAELMQRMGLRFEIRPTHVEEDDSGSQGPEVMVLENAKLKASTLSELEPEALVLGSDTTVAWDAHVLSKPVDLADARRMLQMLSGRTHTVYTAVSLYWQAGGLAHTFVERSDVRFQQLDDARIDQYFARVNPLDKAGAYGIQEGRELIIEHVEGSVENVMGLPIQALEQTLRELGFDFWN
ncbi:Maf family protein [Coraliomargarita sp. SDUM461003]|uniref:dTTP/UTP pyrophosphatase n=1 Tax=Thalassobacterium maritimum TaxID=3041265 RepID=A0ABU1ARG9_9BACT|nr:Maf family protein [Coraliomargarita sp. SDUM461003]MBT61920.1 septum formation protein Maf [Puniceicoccaceae bacterium]MDQ8206758.1 Maf family protein [Coraliomargarita sp. SDUM461003]HBR92862.1 septum formation protein Maf [Opitutae bacterium]|tara:strand:+ start:4864 stop:5454 length:591 start_codon:yes stop_codon:yes gene_type:complete